MGPVNHCHIVDSGHVGVGIKYDQGKPRWDLMPESLEGVARVITFGAAKYAENGWRSVPDGKRRYLAAAFRHIWARLHGELIDPESGLPHTAHAACNMLFLGALDQ